MRRFSSAVFLAVLVSATVAFADVPSEANPPSGPGARVGRHVILHAGALTPADRAELAAKGVVVQTPMTGDRFLAVVRNEAVSDSRIRGIEPLTAQKKILPSVYTEVGRGHTWADVNVIFHEDVPFDEARTAILAAGGTLDPLRTRFMPPQRIEARIAPEALQALANDDRVLVIGGPRRWKVAAENEPSARISHVVDVNAAPYNLTGAGVVVSLFELAAGQGDHVEFGDRVTINAAGGANGDKAHATHVMGTIGAAGLKPEAKGMAPNVRIYQFCVKAGNDCTTDWLDDKDEKLGPLGVVADNNSWGFVLGWGDEGGVPVWNDSAEYYGAYDLFTAAPLDKISNEKNILFVHSAGNDGGTPQFSTTYGEHYHVDADFNTDTTKKFCISPNGSGNDCPTQGGLCNGGCELTRHHATEPFDTIGVTAAAKNIITVGAVFTNLQIASFSSRGPAKDGRVKPEVVARGMQVLSTVPVNTYGSLSGTSMASPVVTGVAALLTEQWRRSHGGQNPTAAQLRALILAGTDDIGNPGPDYTNGFGLVNAKTSADYIINDNLRDLTVGQAQDVETRVVVNATQNLRVFLSWPDPYIQYVAGDDIAAKALVNDLDLKVITPAGETRLPYVLDKDHPTDNATTGVNTVDNEELVEIPNAGPGVYRVIVTGTNVKQGPQAAVLVSNATPVTVKPCRDLTEPNDTAAAAYGDLVPLQRVDAALCTQSDVDFFKFTATKTGPVSVTITTADTAVRATLTGASAVDVPANSTRTITTTATTVPAALTLKIEPTATIGDNPSYSITPNFGRETGTRRRSSRH